MSTTTDTIDKPRRSKRLDRMEAEDERLGRGIAGDRLFFENIPNRNFRARLATAYEVAWHDENGQPISGVRDDGRPYRGFRFRTPPEAGYRDKHR